MDSYKRNIVTLCGVTGLVLFVDSGDLVAFVLFVSCLFKGERKGSGIETPSVINIAQLISDR